MKVKKILAACCLGVTLVCSGTVLELGGAPCSSVAYAGNGYTVNRSSAWYDKPSATFGAGVTKDSTGEYFTVTYQLVDMGHSVYNVMESKNGGDWVQIGVIDWNRMCSADVGSSETGGRLFAEVANVAAQSAGYEKMF